MSAYDKYYQKDQYFGKSYPELIQYFKGLDKKLKVLDIGCGQGRDSLELGRLGFSVVGMDVSEVGIKQMNAVAQSEGLDVHGIVHDMNHAIDYPSYDVVLLDSMFHFYKNDIDHETNLLLNILNSIYQNTRIVIILQESRARVKILKDIIRQANASFIIEYEESILYQEFSSKFFMIAIRKTTN